MRVLWADDDPMIRSVMAMNLEAEGFDVQTVADGDEAYEAAVRSCPDVLVLDIMMPGRDGYTVLRDLRLNPATAEVPVVLLSAKATDAEVWEGWKAGADYYITKPFDPTELTVVHRSPPHRLVARHRVPAHRGRGVRTGTSEPFRLRRPPPRHMDRRPDRRGPRVHRRRARHRGRVAERTRSSSKPRALRRRATPSRASAVASTPRSTWSPESLPTSTTPV